MHLFFKHLSKNCNYNCLYLHTGTYMQVQLKTQLLSTFSLFTVIINQARLSFLAILCILHKEIRKMDITKGIIIFLYNNLIKFLFIFRDF